MNHKTLSLIAALIILVGGSYFSYTVFLDGVYINPPAKILSVTLQKTVYSPGEEIQGLIDLCNYRGMTPTIQWQMVDNTITIYTPHLLYSDEGCAQIPIDVTISTRKLPDTYHLEGSISYKINYFNTVTYFIRTDDFELQ